VSNSEADTGTSKDHAQNLTDALFERLDSLLAENATSVDIKSLVIVEPKEVYEPYPAGLSDAGMEQRVPYYRWRASAGANTLSVRASDGVIELYIIPTSEVGFLSFAEHHFRSIGVLTLAADDAGQSWLLDGQKTTPEDVVCLLQRAVDMLLQSLRGGGSSVPALSPLGKPVRDTRNAAANDLVFKNQNLVYKLVMQQEEVKTRLARDLHDTVIADLMMLKRFILGDRKLSGDEITSILDEIIQRLRDVCQDFAPRNLQDWGLKTCLQALLDRLGERCGIDCSLVCDFDLPDLPDIVQLNIYRIVQEALNNVEKYAAASRLVVRIEVSGATLSFAITDNGAGFAPEDLAKQVAGGSGMGLGTMRERAALIRSFFPATFALTSTPGEGTTVRLEIVLPGNLQPNRSST
jgi:signal transduction histidine kinase